MLKHIRASQMYHLTSIFSTSNMCPTNFGHHFISPTLIRNFHTLTKPPRFVAIRLFVRHVGETWRMEGRRCYVGKRLGGVTGVKSTKKSSIYSRFFRAVLSKLSDEQRSRVTAGGGGSHIFLRPNYRQRIRDPRS